jgi:putative oxidoreductase
VTRARAIDLTHTVLRIVAGALFAIHGTQKLFGWFGGQVQPLGSQLWIGGVIELIGGVMIALGWSTRIAAFICSGQMAVAYFQYHWKLDLAGYRWLPMINQGEDTVLYCFVFLWLAAAGAGPYSLDARRGAT